MKNQAPDSPLGRVAVVRGAHLVPLLADPHNHNPAPTQPWKGVVLERHTVRPGEIPEHEHPTLCLHLQLSGNRDFEWWQNGRNAIEHTRPGALIVIPPGTRDRLQWQGSSERFILSIEDAALQQLTPEHPLEIKGAWSVFDPSLSLVITEMGREARAGWPLGTLYADLLALTLQTNLIRNHATQPVALPSLKGGLSLPKLKRAMEYISSNLAEEIHLEHIAAELDLSPFHFAHLFRNSTGSTPYQYLLLQRLDRAKSLLKTTRLPIQNISRLTGFRYPANFVRTFRQRVGLSPEAWRKSHIT